MQNNHTTVRTSRQWKDTVGVSKLEFHSLVSIFKNSYELKFGISLEEKIKNIGLKNAVFLSYEDIVFFGLYQLKNHLVFGSLGFTFGTDGSNAQRTFKMFIEVISYGLKEEGAMPMRTFSSVAELQELVNKAEDITIDGFEIPIQRPENQKLNKGTYSGKKKRHMIKGLVFSNCLKRIIFLSSIFLGSKHDYSILKEVCDPKYAWFQYCTVRLDLGFKGFKTEYMYDKVSMPYPKKRVKKGEPKFEFTPEQKEYNREQSRIRVGVEHSIGGMKRYRI